VTNAYINTTNQYHNKHACAAADCVAMTINSCPIADRVAHAISLCLPVYAHDTLLMSSIHWTGPLPSHPPKAPSLPPWHAKYCSVPWAGYSQNKQ